MIRALLTFCLSLLLVGCGPSEPELHVYTWADYIKTDLILQFEREYHCHVVIDTFDSNEAMYAKLKAGAVGYDVIFPTNYMVEIMQDQGMLHPIDSALVPNLKYIDTSDFPPSSQIDFAIGVPYTLNYTGVAYRKDKVLDIEQSWAIFGRKDLRGRMTMLNDPRDALGAALVYLGYSPNSIDKEQINKAADVLIAWKKNLAKFESEQYKNGIASAEYLVVQGYNGDILQVIEENDNVAFFLPKEGTLIACDYMVIPDHAVHIDLAHAFINFLCEPSVAAANIQATFYSSPNRGAYLLLDDKLRNNPALFPPKEILQKSELVTNIGIYITEYIKAWDRVKASK